MKNVPTINFARKPLVEAIREAPHAKPLNRAVRVLQLCVSMKEE